MKLSVLNTNFLTIIIVYINIILYGLISIVFTQWEFLLVKDTIFNSLNKKYHIFSVENRLNFFRNTNELSVPYDRFVAVLEGTCCTFHNGKTYQSLQFGIYHNLHSGIDFYLHHQKDYSQDRCTKILLHYFLNLFDIQ